MYEYAVSDAMLTTPQRSLYLRSFSGVPCDADAGRGGRDCYFARGARVSSKVCNDRPTDIGEIAIGLTKRSIAIATR